jgi:hypothetical protein
MVTNEKNGRNVLGGMYKSNTQPLSMNGSRKRHKLPFGIVGY